MLALGLGLARLGHNDIWFDEAASYFFARFGGLDFFRVLMREDTHGPLYYGLLRLSTLLVGEGPWAGRMPSVVCATGAVVVIAFLGARLFCRKVGLAAAVVVALSPFHIYYAQQVRFYSFIEFLAALQVYCFVELLAPAPQDPDATRSVRGSWWGFVLAGAACLWTYYLSGLVLAAEAVVALALWRSIEKRRMLLAFAAIALLWAPWVPAMIWQARHTHGSIAWIKDRSTLDFLAEVYQTFVVGRGLQWIGVVLAPILLVGAAVALMDAAVGRMRGRLLLAGWFLLPLTAVLVISLRKALYESRYLMMILPAFFLLAVAGIFRVRARWLRGLLLLAVVAGLAAADVHHYTRFNTNERWNEVATYLRGRVQENDVLVAAPSHEIATLAYYFPGLTARGAERASHVTGHLASGRPVWLISKLPEHAELRRQVAVRYLEVSSRDFGSLNVTSYLPRPPRA